VNTVYKIFGVLDLCLVGDMGVWGYGGIRRVFKLSVYKTKLKCHQCIQYVAD